MSGDRNGGGGGWLRGDIAERVGGHGLGDGGGMQS